MLAFRFGYSIGLGSIGFFFIVRPFVQHYLLTRTRLPFEYSAVHRTIDGTQSNFARGDSQTHTTSCNKNVLDERYAINVPDIDCVLHETAGNDDVRTYADATATTTATARRKAEGSSKQRMLLSS